MFYQDVREIRHKKTYSKIWTYWKDQYSVRKFGLRAINLAPNSITPPEDLFEVVQDACSSWKKYVIITPNRGTCKSSGHGVHHFHLEFSSITSDSNSMHIICIYTPLAKMQAMRTYGVVGFSPKTYRCRQIQHIKKTKQNKTQAMCEKRAVPLHDDWKDMFLAAKQWGKSASHNQLKKVDRGSSHHIALTARDSWVWHY